MAPILGARNRQANRSSLKSNQGWLVRALLERQKKLVAVFRGKKFEFKSRDKSTWNEAVEYGKSVGIPEEQLDFPTNYIPWPSSAVRLIEQVGTNKRFFLMLLDILC